MCVCVCVCGGGGGGGDPMMPPQHRDVCQPSATDDGIVFRPNPSLMVF